MSCFHPLKRFIIGYTFDGKTIGKVVPYSVDYLFRTSDKDHVWHYGYNDFAPPRSDTHLYRTTYDVIPCGQCAGCRFDYSKNWAARLMLERKYHDDAWFITLTYDDVHVKIQPKLDYETGEITEHMTLCKRDWQLFMKRLRKHYCSKNLRFFACGEYGSQTFRPHFHAIIFGLPLNKLNRDDLTFYTQKKYKEFFYTLYKSPVLERIWQNGHVTVGEVNWHTCSYVARYVTKKANSNAVRLWNELGVEPERSFMSRRPGIAYQYYQDNKNKMIKESYINLSEESGGLKFMPPQYYKNMFSADFPDEYKKRQANAKRFAEAKIAERVMQSDKSYLELLADDEEYFKAKVKILNKRSVV